MPMPRAASPMRATPSTGSALMDKIVNNNFDAHLAEVRRKSEGRPVNQSRKLGRAADPRPMRPVDLEEIRLRRAELTRNVPVPEPPFWGAADDRAGAGQGGRALPQRAHALPIPVGLPEGRPRRSPNTANGPRTSCARYCAASSTSRSARTSWCRRPPTAIGRCAAEGNDVILFDADGGRELTRFSFPRQNKEGGLCIADFFRDVAEQRARRDRPAGRDDGPARLGGGARMVRRQPLPGLPLPARPLGRDGRGLRRIRAQAHPRRTGLCRRGGPRPRSDARPRLPRQPLFLRLPRLPQPRRPEAAAWRCCAPTRSASPSPKKTSSTPSNRPPPSSSTTRRRNTSRCDAAVSPVPTDDGLAAVGRCMLILRRWTAGRSSGRSKETVGNWSE